MTVANLGTLLKLYDNLTVLGRHHVKGYLLNCNPGTRAMLQGYHSSDPRVAEFLRAMQEFGVHPPAVAPGQLPR